MHPKRILEGLIVIAIVGGTIAILRPAIRAARDASRFPDGPYGELIPTDAPQESRRIHHATGFSIVIPPNWELYEMPRDWELYDQTPVVQIVARHRGGGMRFRSLIAVEQVAPTVTEIASRKKIDFHGHVGYEKEMCVQREYTFDDPAWSSYSLFVDVSGKWWLITFGLAKERDTLPPEIAAYIEAIRFNESTGE